MREIVCQQRSDEWYAARAGYITASQMHNVFAKGKKPTDEAVTRRDYKMQLLAERLTGKPHGSTYVDKNMQWGTDYEAEARTSYQVITGNIVIERGFIVIDEYMIGASIDCEADDRLVEIKCPKTATHIDTILNNTIKSEYMYQMQTQMLVTEKKKCDFISYDPRLPEAMQMKIIEVKRDDAMIEKIIAGCAQLNREIESLINQLTM